VLVQPRDVRSGKDAVSLGIVETYRNQGCYHFPPPSQGVGHRKTLLSD
jgi:hypothetical protein